MISVADLTAPVGSGNAMSSIVLRMDARVSSRTSSPICGSPASSNGRMVGFWLSLLPTGRNSPLSNEAVEGLKTSFALKV